MSEGKIRVICPSVFFVRTYGVGVTYIIPISDHDVSVASKPSHTFVLVNVFVIRVEKTAMTYEQVINRVLIFMKWSSRVAPKDIDDLASVMQSSGDLTVSIVGGDSSRKSQALEFETKWCMHQREIRICVAAADVEMESQPSKPCPEPILKMELLITSALAFDKFASPNGRMTFHKDVNDCSRYVL